MLFDGLLNLPWWGCILTALGLTHVTIASVTIYLHRHQAHRALELHPAVAHFFRAWLWLTTGMVTKEWAAIHRKHHAKVETPHDPHSPRVHGINKVLWLGVFLYVKETFNKETMERYGHGTPDDWIERNLYTPNSVWGLWLMGAINVALFGLIPGMLILFTQIAWIPFWAAGVINGFGHFFGYRSYAVEDASTNIVPWGILIGGEELHNNHHAFAASAKLSSKWYEFDVGWMYICILESLGLATVKRLAPTPRFAHPKEAADLDTLHAVIANRYDVLARYRKSLKRLPARESHRALPTMLAMREELAALWERSSASKEQLLRQLQDWCGRAEASGVAALVEFSRRLRSYA